MKKKRWDVWIVYICLLISFFCSEVWAKPSEADSKAPEITATQETGTASVSDVIFKAGGPQPKWKLTAGKLVWAVVVFFIAIIIFRYINRILAALAERWTNARLIIKRVTPVIHICGWAGVIYFIIASIFSPPIETLVAITASTGIAVGFASQDILKNIFGGVMILFDRPFQVGDKIQVKEFYGEVVYIGLRTVRIVTPDDSLVSIPNSEIVNQSVSNSNSGEFNCQVVAEFFLPLTIDVDMLKKLAFRSAGVSRYAYLKKPVAIILKNEVHMGRSMLRLRLKAYVYDLRYEFLFASEMTENLIKALVRHRMIRKDEVVTPNQ